MDIGQVHRAITHLENDLRFIQNPRSHNPWPFWLSMGWKLFVLTGILRLGERMEETDGHGGHDCTEFREVEDTRNYAELIGLEYGSCLHSEERVDQSAWLAGSAGPIATSFTSKD